MPGTTADKAQGTAGVTALALPLLSAPQHGAAAPHTPGCDADCPNESEGKLSEHVGCSRSQNSSEREIPAFSMPGKNPLLSSGSLQPQLGQLVRADGSSPPPGRQGLPRAFWWRVGGGHDLGTGWKSEVNAAQHKTGPTHLLACHFKFNFLCLLFNLMYSFDLSFSCLPEFADTVEA